MEHEFSTSVAALPYSDAGRDDSEAAQSPQSPTRSLTSFDDDFSSNSVVDMLHAKPRRPLKYNTIMLKVSGEALQVGVVALCVAS